MESTDATPAGHGRRRAITRAAATVVCVVVVWLALTLPDTPSDLSWATLARIPVTGVVLVLVAALLPWRWVNRFAVGAGALIAVLVLLKIVNNGFQGVFFRDFDPLNDWTYLPSGVDVLADTAGRTTTVVAVITAGVLTLAILVLMPLCSVRTVGLVQRHRRRGAGIALALGVGWIVSMLFGAQIGGVPVAASDTATLAYHQVSQVQADIRDRGVFDEQIRDDQLADTSASTLTDRFGDTDVLVIFVESYGRTAVQDSSYSHGIKDVLDTGSTTLRDAGYSMRSAFLTSPTFGAGSWLAHSTLQSGLWVDSQQRYNQLMTANRMTLTSVFGQAGWRTVFTVPAITQAWPEGPKFYHFDKLYDAHNVGYRGPEFSYATMPDQYTLDHFWRTELAAKKRRPVMAEIDLVSSHHPWTPLPHLVPWAQVKDGSVFDGMPEGGRSPDSVFENPDDVRAAYGQSIQYSLRTVISFLHRHRDHPMLVIMVGDHEPHQYVTGSDPGRDVPISIITNDPDLMGPAASWDWQPGLRPRPDAPVWRMDRFRDAFLSTLGRSQ